MRNPKCNRPHAKIANMDTIRLILYQFCLVCFACLMYFCMSTCAIRFEVLLLLLVLV